MEAVFRALADPTRRLLLDRLFDRDGRTLAALSGATGMTRFGVMKHLRVLEEAGLITTRKKGREKLHYLNPVPIKLINERWISKYAEPFVSAMADIKHQLEGATMEAPKYVYEIYIRTTPDELWRAITDPERTHRYFHQSRVVSHFKPGGPIEYRQDDGKNAIEGSIIECDAPRRLVHTFRFPNNDDAPTRVTWEITPMGEVCRLSLVHEDFAGETETWQGVSRGWAPILDSLKTLIETGEPMPMPVQ